MPLRNKTLGYEIKFHWLRTSHLHLPYNRTIAPCGDKDRVSLRHPSLVDIFTSRHYLPYGSIVYRDRLCIHHPWRTWCQLIMEYWRVIPTEKKSRKGMVPQKSKEAVLTPCTLSYKQLHTDFLSARTITHRLLSGFYAVSALTNFDL